MDVFSNDSSYPLRKYWILQLCFAIQNLAGRSVSNVLELLVFWILSQNFLQLLASVLANNNWEEQRKHVWFHCYKKEQYQSMFLIKLWKEYVQSFFMKFLDQSPMPWPNDKNHIQHLKGIFQMTFMVSKCSKKGLFNLDINITYRYWFKYTHYFSILIYYDTTSKCNDWILSVN